MPELRHLRCFVVAADELNFTRAAARLHVTQQSLSSTIRLLEQSLGVRLFDRTTRVVKLTAAGDSFLPAARRVVAEADSAFAAVRARAEKWPEVEIGFSFTLDDHVRFELLEGFLSEYPQTRVRIHPGLSGDLIDQLLSGDLDCVVAFCPPRLPGIEFVELMEVPMWVLLSDEHPLAAEETLELDALRQETFILAAEPGGGGFNTWLLDTCRAAGFTPATVISPPLAMNFRPSAVAADAVTLANWHPQLTADGSVLRPLQPPVLAPYAAAIRPDATGVGRAVFEAIISNGGKAAATIGRRDATH